MTVCITTISKEGIIIGAADRMRTAGDVQFEPQVPKIFGITSSIAILTAGDSNLHREIINNVIRIVNDRVQKQPQNWWLVKDVADLYANYINEAKLSRIDNTILSTYGLNHDSFIQRQEQMSNDFIGYIRSQMASLRLPSISAIITGVDMEGPHIYTIDNNDSSCWDTIGFASIGIGTRHANSQLMFAKYSRASTIPDALLATYTAKRRAEVAPGVGEETDMFLIGPLLGSLNELRPDVVQKLKAEYEKIYKAEKKAQDLARKEIASYVDEITKIVPQQVQTPLVSDAHVEIFDTPCLTTIRTACGDD